MKTKILIAVLALSILAAGGIALANGAPELPRWAIGSGTTDASSGDISLNAFLGQPIVGDIFEGELVLGQGFWHGTDLPGSPNNIYLPLVQR